MPKKSQQFYLKYENFLSDPKSFPNILGYFCKNILTKNFNKIGQYGHTADTSLHVDPNRQATEARLLHRRSVFESRCGLQFWL